MTIRPSILLAGTALVALTLTACASADDAEPETTSFGLTSEHLTITKESGGDIELRPADVDDVEVTRWFAGDSGEATWDFDDNELTLATDCGFLSSCDIRYLVLVPHDVALTLAASNGDVTASGFDTALTIQTENGAIAVEDVSGDLTLHSSSGDQHATGLTAEQVQAQASNGTINLTFSDPPSNLAVSTENGAVTLHLPDAAYAVTISTDNGSVENALTEDADSPHAIDVTTENGDIALRTG